MKKPKTKKRYAGHHIGREGIVWAVCNALGEYRGYISTDYCSALGSRLCNNTVSVMLFANSSLYQKKEDPAYFDGFREIVANA